MDMMRQGRKNLTDGNGPAGGQRSIAEARHEKEYREIESRYFKEDGTKKPGAMICFSASSLVST